MRCLICRKETKVYRLMLTPYAEFDEVTGEKFSICEACAAKLKNRNGKWLYFAGRGIHAALKFWRDNNYLTPVELNVAYQDNAYEVAKRILHISSPTSVLAWDLDNFIAVDEPSQRILIVDKIINFSEVEGYKVFDKSIEYHVQSPNSIQYNVSTDKGLRRSIVGGVFAGPAGAVMGGLTANHSMVISEGKKSTYNTTEHDFSVLVKLKTFNHGGAIAVHIGNDEVKMNAFVNLIEKIIK